MICPHCKKEITEVLYNAALGAMFIARDSGAGKVNVWPADWGLRKYEGCVQFGLGIDGYPAVGSVDSDFMVLTSSQCTKIYKDFPKEGEAWLVTPNGEYLDWEHVDCDIEFSERD